MQYYNAHSHVFTMKNAPEGFLKLYLPELVADFVERLTNTQVGANSFAWLLSKIPGEGTKRYASFLRIGKSSDQIDVFRILKGQYPGSTFKFVALSLYMEDCGARTSQTGYEGQLEGLLEIKTQYPDDVLVFLGLDPRWKGSATELRKTIESKFNYRLQVTSARSVFRYVGLKLYPSTGFYAFDAKLKETFEWAADNGVPVLSHCNYMGGIYNNDKDFLLLTLNPPDPYNNNQLYSIPRYQNEFALFRWVLGTNRARNNQLTCSYFLEPQSYRNMASYFHTNRYLFQSYQDKWFNAYRASLDNVAVKFREPLKICLAHYGGDDQILIENNPENNSPPVGTVPRNWCGQIRQLMSEFEGIYTDISYALHNKVVHPFIIRDLATDPLGGRILFGPDFFLTERELSEKKNYTTFREYASSQPILRSNGMPAWDLIASLNPGKFLKSKYFDRTVI